MCSNAAIGPSEEQPPAKVPLSLLTAQEHDHFHMKYMIYSGAKINEELKMAGFDSEAILLGYDAIIDIISEISEGSVTVSSDDLKNIQVTHLVIFDCFYLRNIWTTFLLFI